MPREPLHLQMAARGLHGLPSQPAQPALLVEGADLVMVILCDYAGCERPAVCRIKGNAAGTHVHYCDWCLRVVEARVGVREVEALHNNGVAARPPVPSGSPLSGTELGVLARIAAGEGSYEIAEATHRSAETVKSHVRHILEKLGARNRAHAVALAYEQGLLRVDKVAV